MVRLVWPAPVGPVRAIALDGCLSEVLPSVARLLRVDRGLHGATLKPVRRSPQRRQDLDALGGEVADELVGRRPVELPLPALDAWPRERPPHGLGAAFVELASVLAAQLVKREVQAEQPTLALRRWHRNEQDQHRRRKGHPRRSSHGHSRRTSPGGAQPCAVRRRFRKNTRAAAAHASATIPPMKNGSQLSPAESAAICGTEWPAELLRLTESGPPGPVSDPLLAPPFCPLCDEPPADLLSLALAL